MFRLTLVFVALLTAGCVSLDPDYSRPAAPVPATLLALMAKPLRWSAAGSRLSTMRG